jgi:hypothetical protein
MKAPPCHGFTSFSRQLRCRPAFFPAEAVEAVFDIAVADLGACSHDGTWPKRIPNPRHAVKAGFGGH